LFEVFAAPEFGGLYSPGGPGTTHLFDLASGAELLTLSASDGVDGDMFGVSVDIGEGRVAVANSIGFSAQVGSV
jgi:hypothetical protein